MKLGFKWCLADVYVLRLHDSKTEKVELILDVHMDVIIVAGCEDNCRWLHELLSKCLPDKSLGGLT